MIFEDSFEKVLGIELIFNGEQEFKCYYCLLRRTDNEIMLEERSVIAGNLVQILKDLPKGYPTALNLSGKSVVFKNLGKELSADADRAFAGVFPGISSADFYKQFLTGNANSLIHIIRRSIADSVLGTFSASGLRVYALTLGASVTSVIWDLISADQNRFIFSGHFFELDEHRDLLSCNSDSSIRSEVPVKIGKQELNEDYVVGYAAAFQLLLNERVALLVADHTGINEKLEQVNEFAGLKKKAFLFLTILFVALLLSFLTCSFFNDQNAGLSGKAGAQAASVGQLQLLHEGITQDRKLLEALNWNKGYNYGFMLNELTSICPNDLALTTIALNEASKAEKGPVGSCIMLSGVSGNLSAVNNYMFALRDRKWIAGVKLISYKQEKESAEYIFSLQIALKI